MCVCVLAHAYMKDIAIRMNSGLLPILPPCLGCGSDAVLMFVGASWDLYGPLGYLEGPLRAPWGSLGGLLAICFLLGGIWAYWVPLDPAKRFM